MIDVDAIDQAVAQWEGSYAETQKALALLKSFVGGFRDLTSSMMTTLETLKRKHHVDCATMPRDDGPDDPYCGCGTEFMNQHIQNQAFHVINEWRKLKGEAALEWDHERIWTDYEFVPPLETSS